MPEAQSLTLTLLNIPDQETLLAKLAEIDIRVPPANKQRNRKKELWVFCQLMAALAQSNRLEYPLSLNLHGTNGSPDSILRMPTQTVGIEITQAGGSAYNDVLSGAAEHLGECGYWIDNSPGSSVAIAGTPLTSALLGPPWEGTDPETVWVRQVMDAVTEKIKKLQSDEFKKETQNCLAIYPLTNTPVFDEKEYDAAISLFKKYIQGFWKKPIMFDILYVVKGSFVYEVVEFGALRIPVPNLWAGIDQSRDDPEELGV